VVFVDANGERTITTLGERLAPSAADDLPWSDLDGVDAVYVTAGDPGALREARRARVLVATSRIADLLEETGVRLDAVVGSRTDPAEAIDTASFAHRPRLIVRTESVRGGRYETDDGRSGTYDAVPPPGPVVDTYGAGDSFAAGLTYGLAKGLDRDEALELASRCGAAAMTGRGPYEGQLSA